MAGNPLILLEENQATLKLSVLIRVFVNLDGSILNLLLLKAVSVDGKTSNWCRVQLGCQLGWGRLHHLILPLSACRTLGSTSMCQLLEANWCWAYPWAGESSMGVLELKQSPSPLSPWAAPAPGLCWGLWLAQRRGLVFWEAVARREQDRLRSIGDAPSAAAACPLVKQHVPRWHGAARAPG